MNAPPVTLGRYVRRHALGIGAGVACVLGAVALGLGAADVLRAAVNALAEGALDRAAMTRATLWFLGLSLGAAACSLGMRGLPLKIGHRIEYELRRDLFDHLARLESAYYRGEHTGDLMTRMSSDIGMVRDFIGQGLLQGARAVVVSIGAFGLMFATQPKLAAVVAALVPPMVLAFFSLLRAIRRRHDAVQEQYSELSNDCQETFAGIRTIRGFAVEPLREAGFGRRSRELIRRNLRLGYVQQPLWPMFAFWFGAETALLLLVGGRMIVRGEMALGDLVLFQQLLLYIQWPMLSIGWTASLIQRGRASWSRLQAIFNRAPAIADDAARIAAVGGAAAPQGDLEFDAVSVVRDGRPLLDQVTLRIPRGQTVGFTGPIGSGKSLLVSLVPRLLDPDTGAVRIGGRDLRSFPLADLRRRVGMAPQEPVLFSETLAHNLAFGLDKPEPQTVLWAATTAHLHEEIETFPLRYETVLGERGVTLSGGQRQRAAIGRALARRPDLLILDDTLAAVDTQTEAAILGKLKPVLDQCTTLLVSHRASTLFIADRIVVIQDGRVTADGPPAALAREPGYFRTLVEHQALERAVGMEDAP
jgi:ATP-binding cassette, subfamily B, multidrug efflux pump